MFKVHLSAIRLEQNTKMIVVCTLLVSVVTNRITASKNNYQVVVPKVQDCPVFLCIHVIQRVFASFWKCPFVALEQDFSKVSLYKLGYICTLLKSLFRSELNSVIFNFEHLSSRKLWWYN